MILSTLFLLVPGVFASSSHFEPYQLQVSRSEARATAEAMLTSGWRDAATEDELQRIAKLIRTYRAQANASGLSILDAPYLGYLAANSIDSLYSQAYDVAYQPAFEQVVSSTALDVLFDGFMQAIIDGSLPPSVQAQAGSIDPCMAKLALEGRSSTCPLDLTDVPATTDIYEELRAKLACSTGKTQLTTPCRARIALYNGAKATLIAAKTNPDVLQVLESKFKPEFSRKFRQEFMKKLGDWVGGFHPLLLKKMKVQDDDLWSPSVPLIEGDYEQSLALSLEGFARGLSAEVTAAALFIQSKDAKLRALAAPLFYAAANRLLVLTGGPVAQRAHPPALGFVLAPDSPPVDDDHPKAAPKFQSDPMGGWSIGLDGQQNVRYAPWEWSNYDPTTQGLSLFPSLFTVGKYYVPTPVADPTRIDPLHGGPVEKLDDVALLVSGVSRFLKLTRADGPLGQYFGTEAQFKNLFDPASPMIFPQQGRAVAVGVASGVLRNMILPTLGHLEQKAASDADFGVGIELHDWISLKSRSVQRPSTQTLSHLLQAVGDLREAIDGDASLPPEVTALISQIQAFLDFGTLYLGALGQESSGAFRTELGVANDGHHTLLAQVRGLRGLTRAFAFNQRLIYRVRLVAAWNDLDSFWPKSRSTPVWREEDEAGVQPDAPMIDPSSVWELIELWNESQSKVKPNLTEIPWDTWQQRISDLRKRMNQQMSTVQGPMALDPSNY